MHLCRPTGIISQVVELVGLARVSTAGVNGNALILVLADEFEPKAAIGARNKNRRHICLSLFVTQGSFNAGAGFFQITLVRSFGPAARLSVADRAKRHTIAARHPGLANPPCPYLNRLAAPAQEIRRISPLALIATLAISLSACGSVAFEADSCPTWPAVAEEMEAGAMPPDRFPAFWEWMGRLDKLRDQLLAC